MSEKFVRIALVTGVTFGIGKATPRKFVAAGFGMVGNGRSAAKLTALEKEIRPSFCGVTGDAPDNTVLDKLLAQFAEFSIQQTKAFDEKWGHGFLPPDKFTELVYMDLSPKLP